MKLGFKLNFYVKNISEDGGFNSKGANRAGKVGELVEYFMQC